MDDRLQILIGFFLFLIALGAMIVADGTTSWRFGLRSLFIITAFAAVVIALVAAYARTILGNT